MSDSNILILFLQRYFNVTDVLSITSLLIIPLKLPG